VRRITLKSAIDFLALSFISTALATFALSLFFFVFYRTIGAGRWQQDARSAALWGLTPIEIVIAIYATIYWERPFSFEDIIKVAMIGFVLFVAIWSAIFWHRSQKNGP